ncbi:MAG TPA: HD family phosphohydrolase [Firmicutes bacterium]|jgi:HD superfamily phosphodiesterase|nr:HD family phosphohydrolase [Bacillota bacterium]
MIEQVLNEMITYFKNDTRRINHALKVYGFATTLSGLEKLSEAEKEITQYAAILHDIGIKEAERKYNSSAGCYQEIEGPPIAESILKNLGIDQPTIERICFLIGNHHSYNKIDGLDFQILVEADFLVNIFEDNLEQKSIDDIGRKCFKTKTGIGMLHSIYS